VYVIDTATGTVSNRIRVGNHPGSIAITPDGKHLYVTGSQPLPVSNHGQTVSVVSVIDTATDKVSSRIRAPGAPGAVVGVAINPDGKHAYLSYMGIASGTPSSINVSVITTATGKVSSHFADGTAPGVFTPDGKHAYATNGGFDGTVLVIDTATGEVASRITVGAGAAWAGAITPDGKHLYVASRDRSDIGTVSVIDTATGKVSSRTHVGNNPSSMAITPDGKRAYVTSFVGFDGTVYVIDTATGVVSGLIPVGSLPDVVAITPDGTHAYVTSRFGGSISVIDTATGVVSALIPVGTARDLMGGLAICPAPRP
jgi:YVTN family beta-propeller protein